MSSSNRLDIYDQMAFYGEFHHNKVNQIIHMIFVPIIFWTALVWISQVPFIEVNSQRLNLAFFVALGYSIYYIILEPVAGFLCTPFLLSLSYFATRFALYNPNAMTIALGIHIFSWIIQFIGHGVFEKRAPTLLTSASQALTLAPFFVWLEYLFLFGYRPELKRELDAKIVANIEQWKKSQSQKKDR